MAKANKYGATVGDYTMNVFYHEPAWGRKLQWGFSITRPAAVEGEGAERVYDRRGFASRGEAYGIGYSHLCCLSSVEVVLDVFEQAGE